jgi:taurine dioxygenase
MADSDALIEELLSYLYRDDQIYEHVWKTGDIVIWDNLGVQHARKAISGGTRTLQRVTIAEIGYWDQLPTELPLYEELQTFQKDTAA